jgi:mRNA-degrading endonuclease RelE of RelBE toxin-antitoxin system
MDSGPRDAFAIEYDPEAREDLRSLPADRQAPVRDAVTRHLTHQPDVETHSGSRKQMRPNRLAGWRLRVGPLRVYLRYRGPHGEDPGYHGERTHPALPSRKGDPYR